MKKGELSVNIIIVAAIALIILVILAVLLFKTGNDLRLGTSCQGLQGICQPQEVGCVDLNDPDGGISYIQHMTAKCTSNSDVCCIRQ